MHVEKPDLLKPCPRGIGLDAPDINNAEPAVVVALVGEARLDVLVVVDGFDGRLVDARVARGGEGGDVEDVGGGAAVGGDARAVLFVEFVVEEEEGHVRAGGEPALVRVGGAGVGGAGDLAGGLLVRYVDDGELEREVSWVSGLGEGFYPGGWGGGVLYASGGREKLTVSSL